MVLAENTQLSLCLALTLFVVQLYLLKLVIFPKVIWWGVAIVFIMMTRTMRVLFLAREHFAGEYYKVLYDTRKHVVYLCTLSGGVYARRFENLKVIVNSKSFSSFIDACEHTKKMAKVELARNLKNFSPTV